MIILIDNYDSFTYNLVQYLGDLGVETIVHRNDAVSVDEIMHAKPDAVFISPGPGTPDDSGICLDAIKTCADKNIPLFGVCLGLQAIGQTFGGKVVRAPAPMHGKTSKIFHDGKSVFKDLPSPFTATRYHSLVVDEKTLPDCLEITARTSDNLIMGLAHRKKPIHSVQFHPESIATDHGHALIKNFIDMIH